MVVKCVVHEFPNEPCYLTTKNVQFGHLCSFNVESQIKHTHTNMEENVCVYMV